MPIESRNEIWNRSDAMISKIKYFLRKIFLGEDIRQSLEGLTSDEILRIVKTDKPNAPTQ